MLNMGERWSMYRGPNPVRLVKFLPENNLRFETLSQEQEERLLIASPPYLREMILFAINTGLRTSDIFNLQWMGGGIAFTWFSPRFCDLGYDSRKWQRNRPTRSHRM
jgi:hypothetical protein